MKRIVVSLALLLIAGCEGALATQEQGGHRDDAPHAAQGEAHDHDDAHGDHGHAGDERGDAHEKHGDAHDDCGGTHDQHGDAHGDHGDAHDEHGNAHGDHGDAHGDHGDAHDEHGDAHDEHGDAHDDHVDAHGDHGDAHDKHGNAHDHGDAHDKHGDAHDEHGDAHDDHVDEPFGIVRLDDEAAAASGIVLATAESRSLERSRRLTGRIGIPADRIATLRPRFAGVVREATGRVGDAVAAGARLAAIESSETLAMFAVASPFDGVLIERRVVAGTAVGTDEALYVVADLREVQADFDLFGADAESIRSGDPVRIRDDSGAADVEARLAYVSPLRDVHTQTLLARAVLPNGPGADGRRRWSPGSFVTGLVEIDERAADVAVPPSALQTWRGLDAVFVRIKDAWQLRPVRTGRAGERWVEIVEGLAAGELVATGNTFLLRAEIEKAGATHAH